VDAVQVMFLVSPASPALRAVLLETQVLWDVALLPTRNNNCPRFEGCWCCHLHGQVVLFDWLTLKLKTLVRIDGNCWPKDTVTHEKTCDFTEISTCDAISCAEFSLFSIQRVRKKQDSSFFSVYVTQKLCQIVRLKWLTAEGSYRLQPATIQCRIFCLVVECLML
jgi:hypothetical protein